MCNAKAIVNSKTRKKVFNLGPPVTLLTPATRPVCPTSNIQHKTHEGIHCVRLKAQMVRPGAGGALDEESPHASDCRILDPVALRKRLQREMKSIISPLEERPIAPLLSFRGSITL